MKDEREREAAAGGSIPEKTDELLEAAQRRGRGLLDRQKNAAVEELSSVADVMREAAQRFEERQEGGLAGYAEKAAGTLDRVSAALRDREVGDLLREAETAIRSRPAVGLAATAVAGFVIGRFLRASSRRIAAAGREAEDVRHGT